MEDKYTKSLNKKPDLVYNAIAHQSKTNGGLSAAEWNFVINTLRNQTNNTAKNLERLYRWLIHDWDHNTDGVVDFETETQEHGFIDYIKSIINNLHKVAYSGKFGDLINIPEEFPPAEHEHDYVPIQEGKDLVATTEIARLALVDNYDDTAVKQQITDDITTHNTSETAHSDIRQAIAEETNAREQAIEEALESKADLVDGKVPREQLPSFVDDIIEGFYINGQFYSEGEESPEYLITPEFGKLYVDVDTNKMYRALGGTYEEIPSPFELTKAKVEAVLTGDITSHNHATEIANHNTSETAHSDIRNTITNLDNSLSVVAKSGDYNDLLNTPTQDKIVFLDLTNEEYTSKTLSSNTKNEIANAILGLIKDGEFQTTDIVLRIDGDLKQTLVSYYISNNEEPYIVLQFGANLAYNDCEAPPYKVLIITNSAVTLENAEDYNYNFITRLGYGNADFGSFKHVASARGENGNYIYPYARTTAPVLYDFVKGELNNKIASLKGQNNGLAELDASGKVPSTQLPSYVDDVLEYAKLADFPATGEDGKIYVAKDTNLTYRWSGSGYTEISASLALGETSSTAYAGDKGKTAYDHSQSAHAPSNAQKNSDITKGEIEAKLTGEISSHSHALPSHNHDDIYYTESEIDTKLGGKANATHNHTKSEITDFPTSMPPTAHNHDGDYYKKSETYTKAQTDALVGDLAGETQELKSITTEPTGTFVYGDKYYNSSTKGLYYYTGSAWELTGAGEPLAGVIYSFNGTLYFWNDTEQDLIQIGGGVDLTNYYTKTEIDNKISTNIETDKLSNTKTTSAKAVYDFVNNAILGLLGGSY